MDPYRHQDWPDSNYQDLQISLSDLGYTDPVCLKYVEDEIKKQSKAVANTFINMETPFNPNYIGQRTDFLDITFRLCLIRGLVIPVLTCVTDKHICLDVWENRAMNSDPESPSRTILHVIVMRSHGVLLKDKTFLIAVDEIVVKHRISFFDESRKFGNKIIVVTTRGTERLRELVDTVLEYDLSDVTDYKRHADNIMALLQKRGIVVSGCFTPRDCYTLLVCRLRELLGRRGPSEEAFNIADNKFLTYSTLWSMPSKRYSSKVMRVNDAEDLKLACQKIDFPAFIKLERGHSSIGAQVVKNEKECMKCYADLSTEIVNNLRAFELYGSATSMVLTEFLEGKEYAIDIVLFKGELITAYIRNLSPHSPPSFVWRALSFPGNLTEDKRAMIIRASYQICIDIGLLDGVFNVEIMMTPAGPRLIEVNARQGNYALSNCIKQCLDEDFFLMQMLINLGIRPTIVPLPPQRKGYVFLLSSLHHNHLFANPNIVAMVDCLTRKNMIFYDTLQGFQPSTYDMVTAYMGVVDEDAQKAKSTLLTIARALGLESPFYPCEYFLKNI